MDFAVGEETERAGPRKVGQATRTHWNDIIFLIGLI